MQKTDKNDKIRQRLLHNAIIDWENTSRFDIPTEVLQEFYRYANYIFTVGYDIGYSDGKDAGKSMSGHGRPVRQFYDGKMIDQYGSMQQAAKSVKGSKQGISAAVKYKKKYKGYFWKLGTSQSNTIPEEIFNRAKNIVETDSGVFCLDCFKYMGHSPQGRFINRYICPICRKEVIIKK